MRGSPFAAGDGPNGLCAAGGLLFAANETGRLSAYRVGSKGSLTPAPGSPFAVGTNFVYNVNVAAGGRFVYTADASHEQVFGFRVNRTNAALTALPGSPFAMLLWRCASR